MKQLAVLIYSTFLFSCNQNAQTKTENMPKSDKESYALELIESGFLKYADSLKVDSLRAKIIASFDIHDKENFKIAHIDAEELSEFSFDFFMPTLNQILAKRDFKLSAEKLNDKDNSFDVTINGDIVQLYTQNELNNGIFWDTASRNFFKKVNELLNARNSKEKFYLLYGGNDLHTLLLTDKEFSIISEYYKESVRERPYKP